jgi:hypothetical protein
MRAARYNLGVSETPRDGEFLDKIVLEEAGMEGQPG